MIPFKYQTTASLLLQYTYYAKVDALDARIIATEGSVEEYDRKIVQSLA